MILGLLPLGCAQVVGEYSFSTTRPLLNSLDAPAETRKRLIEVITSTITVSQPQLPRRDVHV